MLHLSEVRVGLVLRMDPHRLLEYATEVTTDERFRACDPHWFICVGRDGDQTDWVATSSKPAPERTRITRKWGHPTWREPPTFADLYQVWRVRTFLALRAATLGVDNSFPGARNFAMIDLTQDGELAA